MTNIKIISGAGLFVLAVFMIFAHLTDGMGSKAQIPSSQLEQAYVWYDGDQERKVWLNPGLIAEFPSDKDGPENYPEAMASVRQEKGARVWRLEEGSAQGGVIRGLKTSHPQGRFSPVFHDGSTSGGRKRALPGNIIVYLDPAWDSPAVRQWVSERNLEIIQKLEIGPNIFVLKTGPGLEALELANTLYLTGEVVAAMPNWWKEVSTR